MKVYTTNVQLYDQFTDTDITFINATIKSGYPWLAPDWSFLMDYKNGSISQEEYRDLFAKKIIASWRDHKQQWQDLVKLDTVALGCYCKKNEFCHRYILVEYLRLYCVSRGIDFEYLGEWCS